MVCHGAGQRIEAQMHPSIWSPQQLLQVLDQNLLKRVQLLEIEKEKILLLDSS